MEFAEDTLAPRANIRLKNTFPWAGSLKGDVFMATEKIEEAAECFEKARDLPIKWGIRLLMWKTRFSLGQIYNQQGKL